MESHVKDRVTIYIKATAVEHRIIIPDLLTAHTLNGCDTTACYFGIEKDTIVKTLKTQNSSISSLGDPSANMEDVLKQFSNFIAACYSVTGEQITIFHLYDKRSGLLE